MSGSEIRYSRVNRSIDKAAEYYSRLSGIYDLLAASEKKFVKYGLDLLDPQPGERILEIGSGTGFAQVRLLEKLENGFCAGVDISPGMTQVARKKMIQAGLKDRLALVQGNSLPLPFPAASFNGVFMSFVLELFDTPHIPEILGEIKRVLLPGGRLVLASLSRDKPLPLMGRIYERAHDLFPELLDCRPIPVLPILKESGFIIQRGILKLMWGLPVMIAAATTGQP